MHQTVKLFQAKACHNVVKTTAMERFWNRLNMLVRLLKSPCS
jgi:hypothetical protein